MTGHRQQIAAVPMTWTDAGRLHVLMVTSRGSGRWIMPKGWIMSGREPWSAAAIEALEEAGAEGYVSPCPIGCYGYDKVLDGGLVVPCRVEVYAMVVQRLRRKWKERRERRRRWFTPAAAARRVQEAELAALLLGLGGLTRLPPDIEDLRRAS